MPFDLTVSKNPTRPVDAKKAAIEAARSASQTASGKEPAAIIKYVSAGECPDRNRIVFDDSGSMCGQYENAKQGVVEYLRNCIPNQTSVALHYMNGGEIPLNSNLIELSVKVQEKRFEDGGTPFFNTCKKALESTPQLTRMIAFTDGSPTDSLDPKTGNVIQNYWGGQGITWTQSADVVIKIAKSISEKCIPIDTVFFGSARQEREINLLKYLSSETGGYFLHFDPAKVNFKTAFKYLAPVNRLMLASESFRADVESGRKS